MFFHQELNPTNFFVMITFIHVCLFYLWLFLLGAVEIFAVDLFVAIVISGESFVVF